MKTFVEAKTATLLISLLMIFAIPSGMASGKEADLQVLHSDFSSIRMTLEISDLGLEVVETKAGPYVSIFLEDYGFTNEVGRPRLPVIREFLQIPYGAEGGLRLVDAEYGIYSLAEKGLAERVVPAQAPVPKVEGAREAAPFVIDEEVYSTDGWCLDVKASFREAGFVRGSRVGILEIHPVSYNPVEGTLKVMTRGEIEIFFTGSDSARTQTMADRYATPAFTRLAARIFVNHGAFSPSRLIGTMGAGRSTGYLIIAHSSFMANAKLQDFITHKQAAGFEVTLVDSMTAGGTKEKIQSYIKDAYDTWPTPPAYVLLVGDTNHISHWTGGGSGSPPTDINYGQVEGSDYFPDIYIGRFSVTSDGQINNLVDKILAMQHLSHKKSVFMASVDYWWISEGSHNHCINNYLKNDGWEYDKLYCKTYNAKTYQVTNAFNNGRSLGVFSGHGSTTSWSDGPKFSQSNVKALTNTIYPVVMSFACLTGKYNNTECFAETWIRDDHGATLFWGASVSSYWDEDDYLQKKVFEGWYTYGKESFAEMGDYGKYKLHQHLGGGGTARRYYEMYNIMGDPSIKILGEGPGGSFTNFGTGIPSSTYGQPLIIGTGDLTPGGNGFSIDLADLRPLATGVFFLGLTNSGGIPFMGGYFYPFPISLSFNLQADPAGTLNIPGEIPPHHPGNVHLYVQTFFNDDTGPHGVTATDGLDMWIP